MPVLSIPAGTSSRCQQCWAGKRRSPPSSLAWLQPGEQSSSSPSPALPGELGAPCTLFVGLQSPKSSSTMKIKIKPESVLLEQWFWIKLWNSPSRERQRGPLPPLFPANPAGRQRGGSQEITPSLSSSTGSLGLIPWLGPPPCQPLPAPPEPTPAAAGRAERKGQGEQGPPGGCGAPGISSAPFPGRDDNREMQSLISGGIRSWGSRRDRHSTGKQHLDPIQLLLPSASVAQRSCLLPHRQRNSGEGRERPRNIQEMPRKIPALPPTSESNSPLWDPAPASLPCS